MKKLLVLLLCLLPVFALAEELPVLESEVPLQFAYDPTRLSDCVMLPGDIPLLYYTSVDGSQVNDCLVTLAPNGDNLWQLIFSPRPQNSNERSMLAVGQTDLSFQLYDLTAGTFTTAQVGFDGQFIEGTPAAAFESGDLPAIYNLERFRVERWFGDYTEMLVPTTVTHLPSGQSSQLTLPGQGSFHSFGDWLMYITYDEPGGRYWLIDQQGQMLVENAPAPFGCDRPIVGFSAQDEDHLYLFVWNNSPAADGRSYTVFPVDAEGDILPALTTFNLGRIESEDFLTDYAKSLSQPVVMGEGFMLLALHPWQWGQPGQTDLYYLDRAGQLTLLDTFTQEDEVFLLPGLDGSHCRLICRKAGGEQLLLRTYVTKP